MKFPDTTSSQKVLNSTTFKHFLTFRVKVWLNWIYTPIMEPMQRTSELLQLQRHHMETIKKESVALSCPHQPSPLQTCNSPQSKNTIISYSVMKWVKLSHCPIIIWAEISKTNISKPGQIQLKLSTICKKAKRENYFLIIRWPNPLKLEFWSWGSNQVCLS